MAEQLSPVNPPCPWCKLKPGGECALPDCDFKTLKYEKDAILERVNSEIEKIELLKGEVSVLMGKERAREVMFEIVDRSKGLDIMAGALKRDFGMNDQELSGLFKSVAKARLDARLAALRNQRRAG